MTWTGSLKPAWAAAGAASASAAATAVACLSMPAVLRAGGQRRFHEIAQLRRRDAERGAEAVGEVRRRAVAEVGREPRERRGRVLVQALDRRAQPQVVQVGGQRAPGALAEHAREVERRDMQLGGQRAERERLGE